MSIISYYFLYLHVNSKIIEICAFNISLINRSDGLNVARADVEVP